MNHIELLNSLAFQLRDPEKVQFKEPNLNGWAMGGDYGSPDLLVFNKSYSRFIRHIYEVKASTADLLSDLKKEKWTRYIPICDRITFAIEEGIDFEKHLRHLPVGIMVHRKNDTWRTVRAAPVNLKGEPWPDNVWMALLFGKMGKRDNDRLERMEAEARILRSEEMDMLRHTAIKRIAEKAGELYQLEKDLGRRKEKLDERDKATEADHYKHALDKLCLVMQVHPWSVDNENDLFSRWSRDILNNAVNAAKEKLLAPAS